MVRRAVDKLREGKRRAWRKDASMTPENPKQDPADSRDAAPAAPGAGSGASAPAPTAGAAASAATTTPAATGGAAAFAAAPPVAARPAPATAPPPAKPQPVDEFDPLQWDVPLICKDCDKPFVVPYRNFHAGVVFHCPACQGSWVPNTTIAKGMRKVFEGFWGERKRTRAAFERGELKLDREAFERRQADELKAFRARLEELAKELKPAGKLVRPKGLAAMFT